MLIALISALFPISLIIAQCEATGYGAPPPPPPPYGGVQATPAPQPAVSEGQCEFDSSCWTTQPQCAIAKGVPFKRETGITCEECLEMCLCTRNDPAAGPWKCLAATYDHRWNICDLFAVDGSEAPQSLVSYEGRDYFKPSGTCDDQCGGAETTAVTDPGPEPTTTPAAPDDICDEPGPNGEAQVARFCRWDGFILAETGEEWPDAASEDDCIEACRTNANAKVCFTADFSGGVCTLYDSPPPEPANQETLIPSPGDSWLMKVCVPESYDASTGRVWDIVPDMILVGFVEEVTDATGPLDCKLQCLDAIETLGIECHSAMFYASDPDQNCLLNTETRDTFPENFVPEDPSLLATYLEIPLLRRRVNIAARRRLRGQKRRANRGNSITKFHNIIFAPTPNIKKQIANAKCGAQDFTKLRQGDFTKWSNCLTSVDGKQYRYERCTDTEDIRKCPRQAKDCKTGEILEGHAKTPRTKDRLISSDTRTSADNGKCTVLIDDKGKKKCPLGVMHLPDGGTKFCRNPPECRSTRLNRGQ